MIMGFVIAFQILSAIGKTSVFRAIEINGSYMAAFLILLAAMIKRETRDALACQLALVGMVNCGFCLFEMLFPSAVVSISSSQVSGEVIRSAGIYAKAIASGLMVSAMLLFVTLASTKNFATRKEKLAMVTLTGLTGIGVVVTFSRAAALAFFLVGMLVAFRLANNQVNKLVGYLPIVFVVILISFVGTGEYLAAKGGLSTDATSRYDMVKEALTGNIQPVIETLEFRARAWGPTKRYWKDPKIMGQGYNFVAEKGFFPPHNMVILTLVETGWLGLLFFGFLLVFLVGPGTWSLNFKNLMLIMSILLPIALIVIESHSFFTRRYFAMYVVLLVFTTRILLNPKKIQR
jgi:O-antigen ligase